jgi:hypothetical protein
MGTAVQIKVNPIWHNSKPMREDHTFHNVLKSLVQSACLQYYTIKPIMMNPYYRGLEPTKGSTMPDIAQKTKNQINAW